MTLSPFNSRRLYRRAAFVALCITISSGPASAKATYATFDAGFVTSINSSNTVVGYDSTEAFVRTPDGTTTSFGVPGGSFPEAWSINDSGMIAGYYHDDANVSHGFVRAGDGTITTFDGPKASGTIALHINNKGEISGQYLDDKGGHGFVRTAGGRLRTFDVAGAISTDPGCINDKGAIAGSFLDSNHLFHGFVRAPDGTITTLDVPGAAGGTFAGCINIKGTVVGTYYNGNGDGEHGFVRTPDGTITRFDGQDCDISPAGINRKGVIAGWCQNHDNPAHVVGFVRHPDNTIREFHIPNGGGSMPRGINDAGVIAGDYKFGNFLRFP